MTIRSLNDDRDTLSVFRQPDGDIQVTISHHTGHYADSHLIGVRVGGCGSGHSIPRRIWSLLNELANEFEKFEDCKNEQDAYYKEMKDTMARLPVFPPAVGNQPFQYRVGLVPRTDQEDS